ncbi:hypothetical protein [Hymenobacter rubripertinctus]|uniref:DUF4168 domain-containing protein n=1 Tax=Hymenobacter rubripertinctus TaxID=2029981 RepID=A0A418QIQ0_9BACT|nr:hypothetical protein [Hymenobacter rubripertinctus]RIY05032.1 hypothetical protein D0T11_21090 [Hymenobacter rubripertinctus]
MKYLFTLFLLLAGQVVQAQASLLIGGIRAATAVGTLAARNSKAKAKMKANPSAATAGNFTAGVPASAFTYRGRPVSRQRTAAGTLQGKGAEEILALEATLEQSYQALLADSVQPFLPAPQREAIARAARQAAAARPSWNYSS